MDWRWRVAVHEAGHAAVAVALGCRVRSAELDAFAGGGGRVDVDLPGDAHARRLVTAAGIAAVQLFLGSEDVAHADRAELGHDLEAALGDAREILSKRRHVRFVGRAAGTLYRTGRLEEAEVRRLARKARR